MDGIRFVILPNMKRHIAFLLISCWVCLLPVRRAAAQHTAYPWLDSLEESQSIRFRIPPPAGFERMPVRTDSFAEWLQNLPLKPAGTIVYLYNGERKGNQRAHFAVVDIDPGKRDLQQCADAVMRLRAEYLRACGSSAAISFNFTSGDAASYEKWQQGYRPQIQGNAVSWRKTAAPDADYAGFRQYLETVFTYAGTWSLSKEMIAVPVTDSLQAGDVFIRGGFPGHAVIVVAVAANPDTGEKRFLLAQSYMPAQDIHILDHPLHPGNPWYEIPSGKLYTPEWTFEPGSLMRFPTR